MVAILSKPGTLNVSRKHLWCLVARNMQLPGQPWQRLSVLGFTVMFASRRDAQEFRLTYGGSQFPLQANLSDDAYEAWLDHFVKLEPYESTGRYEVWGHNAMRGWVPTTEEVLTGRSDSQYEPRPQERHVTVADRR